MPQCSTTAISSSIKYALRGFSLKVLLHYCNIQLTHSPDVDVVVVVGVVRALPPRHSMDSKTGKQLIDERTPQIQFERLYHKSAFKIESPAPPGKSIGTNRIIHALSGAAAYAKNSHF